MPRFFCAGNFGIEPFLREFVGLFLLFLFNLIVSQYLLRLIFIRLTGLKMRNCAGIVRNSSGKMQINNYDESIALFVRQLNMTSS